MLKNMLGLFLSFFLITSLSALAVTADSSDVTPIDTDPSKINPNLNIEYPKTTTKSVSIANENYSALVSCPGDPSNDNTRLTSPICPDVNGVYPPGGSAATCPATCSVTRYVGRTQQIGNWTFVSAVIDPVCPAGYVELSSFGSGPRIISSHFRPAPFPLPTLQEYYLYNSQGYNCHSASPGSFIDCDVNYPTYPTETITLIAPPGLKPGVGTYSTITDTGALCGNGGWKYIVNYVYMQCDTPPSGVYDFKNLVSTSRICGLDTEQWQPINKQN